MITPIRTITINQIIARQDDLLVSADDVKAIAKNERAKVLDDVHKAMAYKYHCKEDMCEVGMTCADCLKAYMEDLYSNK